MSKYDDAKIETLIENLAFSECPSNQGLDDKDTCDGHCPDPDECRKCWEIALSAKG